MARWVDQQLSREPAAIFVYSGVMGQYVLGRTGGARLVTDLVDVDSEKWRQYAERSRGPAAWIYRREASAVLRLERRLAQASDATLFVSEPEAALFRRRAPDCSGKVRVVGNGIDHEFFDPELPHMDPFPTGCQAIVLTGAMDYWPNIDAADFFQADVLPRLRARFANARFYVVGRNPSPRVRALESDAVVVTGGVADVRPYLRHAALVVAPMRIARGIQNKVLEGMAMARAVVTTPSGYEGLAAHPDTELLIGADAAALAAACEGLLADPARAERIGAAARQRILADYNWPAKLAALDELL
jgi:sugar transferase (PEP-CTERM/EpsH1 system associated)